MQRESAPMRIGYLVKTFPRLSETFILNEILGLERLGMELAIYSVKRPLAEPLHPAVADVRAPLRYLPGEGALDPVRLNFVHLAMAITSPRSYWKALRLYLRRPGALRMKEFRQGAYLAWSLKRQGITHLHAHFANLPTSIAEVVTWLTGIPYSFTAHAKDIYLTNAEDLTRKIDGATIVLTCTDHNREHLLQFAGDKSKVHLAYHGIDTERFGSVDQNMPIPEKELPMVLSVGRFCEKKGFEYLLEACRLLKIRGHSFRCVIVGYGELKNKLKDMIHDLDLQDCVEMPGKMTQDQLAILYRQAMMFVLPCLVTDDGDRDGIPNVLFEAMVSRVPVVSTNVSGISELVAHMSTGILVEEKDAEAVAGAMELLMASPELRARLSQAGRTKVLKHFTLEASAQNVYALLTSAMRSKEGDHDDSPGADTNSLQIEMQA